MSRPIIPVNFDNDIELFKYVNGKSNKAEFIRYCIRKEMGEERKDKYTESELDKRIERIIKKCLKEHGAVSTNTEMEEDDLMDVANFFEED